MQRVIRLGLAGLCSAALLLGATALPADAAGKFTGVSKPTISGTKAVGKKLTATADTTTRPTADKVTYQWLRSGSNISGATRKTYAIKAADKGKKLSVKACYLAKGTSTRCVTSARTSAVKAGTLAAAQPSITGVAKVGATLKASTGPWTSGATLTYTWLRNGKAISGAKKSSYKVTSADKGKKIQVKVTGKKSGYTSRSRSSAKTATASYLSSKQKRAVSDATSYLRWLNFSRPGLIGQLKYEGYSTSTAKVAVDYLGVNWKKQALQHGRSYLDSMAFSEAGLIDQLQYEEYTSSQISYAISNIHVNWKKQAARMAESYLDAGFSYWNWDEMYDQLRYEGFTKSQAAYGADSAGL